MGQQFNATAQRQEMRPGPRLPRQHGQQQVATTRALIFLLYRPAVEQGLAQNPAIVQGDKKALYQALAVVILEISLIEKGLGRNTRQGIGNQVAPFTQFQGLRVPFPVLHPATVITAGIGFWRQHGAVMTEPAHTGKRTPRLLLHLLYPGLVGRRVSPHRHGQYQAKGH